MSGWIQVQVTGRTAPRVVHWSPVAAGGLWALSVGLALAVSLASVSYPARVREARAYDQARTECLRTRGGSGCRYEPAVLLGQWGRPGNRKPWRIRLALAAGPPRTELMSRGYLGDDLYVGTRLGALFWRGKVALLIRGRDQAETWASPEWRLWFGCWCVGMGTACGLLITVPLVFGTAGWLRRTL